MQNPNISQEMVEVPEKLLSDVSNDDLELLNSQMQEFFDNEDEDVIDESKKKVIADEDEDIFKDDDMEEDQDEEASVNRKSDDPTLSPENEPSRADDSSDMERKE